MRLELSSNWTKAPTSNGFFQLYDINKTSEVVSNTGVNWWMIYSKFPFGTTSFNGVSTEFQRRKIEYGNDHFQSWSVMISHVQSWSLRTKKCIMLPRAFARLLLRQISFIFQSPSWNVQNFHQMKHETFMKLESIQWNRLKLSSLKSICSNISVVLKRLRTFGANRIDLKLIFCWSQTQIDILKYNFKERIQNNLYYFPL